MCGTLLLSQLFLPNIIDACLKIICSEKKYVPIQNTGRLRQLRNWHHIFLQYHSQGTNVFNQLF